MSGNAAAVVEAIERAIQQNGELTARERLARFFDAVVNDVPQIPLIVLLCEQDVQELSADQLKGRMEALESKLLDIWRKLRPNAPRLVERLREAQKAMHNVRSDDFIVRLGNVVIVENTACETLSAALLMFYREVFELTRLRGSDLTPEFITKRLRALDADSFGNCATIAAAECRELAFSNDRDKPAGNLKGTPRGEKVDTGGIRYEQPTDDSLPKKKRKLSPSRLKAKAAYDWAMSEIQDAEHMTIVELYDAIDCHPSNASDALPSNAETFGRYLRDAGVKRYGNRTDKAGHKIPDSDSL